MKKNTNKVANTNKATNTKFNSKSKVKPHSGARVAGGSPRAASGGGGDIPKNWRAVVGSHAIGEAFLVNKQKCKKLWVRQTWESAEDLRAFVETAQRARVQVEFKADAVLDKIAFTHQGAVLYVEGAPIYNLEKFSEKEFSVVLMLDGLEDPHNLGAIMRTAWLMGADGIITPEDRAVGLTPIVHKVACGGVEHVPLVQINNFTNHAEALKKQGYWVFGLSHKATRSLFDLDLPEKVVWAIGSEDKGLRGTTEKICDELVSIPQVSAGASYNASVATAIALTETYRQFAQRGKNSKA